MTDAPVPMRDPNLLKERELNLSEEKIRNERELKEQELALSEAQLRQDRELKEREFQLKHRELAFGRWSGPVAVAVVAGLLGIIGTLIGAAENRELERKKQEGTLLLEAIRTGTVGKEREQQAAANIVFLADAGLVALGKDQIDKMRERAGDATPSLPTATSSAPSRLPEPIQKHILKSFDDLGRYFEGVGAKTIPKVGVDVVSPDVPAIAYYDPDKSTVYIDPQRYLADANLPLREYAHAVLYAGGKFTSIDYQNTWVYLGIESGLASYFSSSFRNDPHVPGDVGDNTLESSKNLKDLKPGPSIMMDGIYYWGGAFWELRKLVGQKIADKLLYSAWESISDPVVRKNDPKDFVDGLLKADALLEQSRYDNDIKSLFRRRGVEQ